MGIASTDHLNRDLATEHISTIMILMFTKKLTEKKTIFFAKGNEFQQRFAGKVLGLSENISPKRAIARNCSLLMCVQVLNDFEQLAITC